MPPGSLGLSVPGYKTFLPQDIFLRCLDLPFKMDSGGVPYLQVRVLFLMQLYWYKKNFIHPEMSWIGRGTFKPRSTANRIATETHIRYRTESHFQSSGGQRRLLFIESVAVSKHVEAKADAPVGEVGSDTPRFCPSCFRGVLSQVTEMPGLLHCHLSQWKATCVAPASPKHPVSAWQDSLYWDLVEKKFLNKIVR